MTAEEHSVPFRIDHEETAVAGFEIFYDRHRDEVAKTLAFSFNDQELGFEAADEAMIRAYRNWANVSTYANPQGWVFRVGLNWGRSWIRRQLTASAKAPLLAAEQQSPTIEDLAADPDLAAAISALKPKQRTVVVLRFHSDYSVAQIAKVLELSEGTVKSRLSRAMQKLAEHLDTEHHTTDKTDHTEETEES